MAGIRKGGNQKETERNRIFKDVSFNLVSIHCNIGTRTTFSFNFTRFRRQIKVSLQLFPLHLIWLISFNINGVKRGCMSPVLFFGFIFSQCNFLQEQSAKR